MSKTVVYRGLVVLGHGENDSAVTLYLPRGSVRDVLAEQIEWDMAEYGQYLTARYIISDKELSAKEAEEVPARIACGLGFAEYAEAYSEITGYLWTDQNIQIGGHDLQEELRGYAGKWLWLEITYDKKPGP